MLHKKENQKRLTWISSGRTREDCTFPPGDLINRGGVELQIINQSTEPDKSKRTYKTVDTSIENGDLNFGGEGLVSILL